MKDYYKEVDDCLRRIELGKYAEHNLDWCADRVDWLYKWNKIPRDKSLELAKRITILYGKEL